MFTGFSEETIRFFLDIRFHNSVSYYGENQQRFEDHVKAPFYAFIDEMAPAMRRIDPQMEVRPYRCLARIWRDVRFTKDKSPFRDHLWVLFRRAAEPREGSVMYWFELSPQHMEWGLGIWGENRPLMDMLRRRIAADPAGVQKIIDSCHLARHHLVPGGSAFKRLEIPPSVPESLKHWYLLRDVYIARERIDMAWAYDPSLTDKVAADFKALAPMYRLLRGAFDEAAGENA